MKIETQQNNFKELIELIENNPTLTIVPMVDSEIVASDDFGNWMGGWGKAELDEIYSDDERIYFRSTDEEEIVEKIVDHLEWDENLTEEEALEKAENEVKNYEWKKVIVVSIVLP